MEIRIKKIMAYNGWLPITAFIVQKRIRILFFWKWVNIKGYEDKEKAIDLYNILNNGSNRSNNRGYVFRQNR